MYLHFGVGCSMGNERPEILKIGFSVSGVWPSSKLIFQAQTGERNGKCKFLFWLKMDSQFVFPIRSNRTWVICSSYDVRRGLKIMQSQRNEFERERGRTESTHFFEQRVTHKTHFRMNKSIQCERPERIHSTEFCSMPKMRKTEKSHE